MYVKPDPRRPGLRLRGQQERERRVAEYNARLREAHARETARMARWETPQP